MQALWYFIYFTDLIFSEIYIYHYNKWVIQDTPTFLKQVLTFFFLFHRRRIFNQPGIRSTKRLGSQDPSEIGLGLLEQVWTSDWQGQDFSGKTEHSKSKNSTFQTLFCLVFKWFGHTIRRTIGIPDIFYHKTDIFCTIVLLYYCICLVSIWWWQYIPDFPVFRWLLYW